MSLRCQASRASDTLQALQVNECNAFVPSESSSICDGPIHEDAAVLRQALQDCCAGQVALWQAHHELSNEVAQFGKMFALRFPVANTQSVNARTVSGLNQQESSSLSKSDSAGRSHNFVALDLQPSYIGKMSQDAQNLSLPARGSQDPVPLTYPAPVSSHFVASQRARLTASRDTKTKSASAGHSIYSAAGTHARLTYKLHPSIWDASIFIGTPNLGIGVSSALVLCLIFNVLLLAMFMGVINSVLHTSEFSESNIAEFEFWRSTIAHDVSLRNPITGESLASGVCNKKESTPFSSIHIMNIISLDRYLMGFGSDRWSIGAVMCALCLSVWFMMLVGEVRDICHVTVACWGLPTNGGFVLEAIEDGVWLTGISTCRRIMMVALAVVRMGVVAMLACYGVKFLVFEISVTDILLDAVSLGFIIQVDELLFCSLAPKVARTLLDRMLPMPLPQFAPMLESAVLPFFIFVPFVLITLLIMVPNVKTLTDSREALCGGVGGSLDFVVAVDAIGIPWAAPTPAVDHAVSSYSSYAGHATLQVRDLGFRNIKLQPQQRDNLGPFMHVHSGDTLEMLKSTLPEFRRPADWKMLDVTNFAHVLGWNELDVLGPVGHDFGDEPGTVYNHYLHYLLGMPPTANTSCSQVPLRRCNIQGSTIGAVVMRQLCPSRCGCDEPTNGTVGSFQSTGLGLRFSGCAPWNLRKQRFQDALASLPCTDTSARNMFSLWASGFGNTLLMGQTKLLRDHVVASFVSGGCLEAATSMLGLGIRICEETSMPAICPDTCGCNTRSPFTFSHSRVVHFCPKACKVAKTLCFTSVRNYTRNLSTNAYGPLAGNACIFPFVYKGRTYRTCTSIDWPLPWCAVTLVDDVVYHWGHCSDTC